MLCRDPDAPPSNEILGITFWLNSEAVETAAIVRTCDGGVGVGIEFTGLDEAAQQQLQQHLEKVAAESRPLPGSARSDIAVFSIDQGLTSDCNGPAGL